jgi:outer membrane protein OmpA-like peptidoglycan-associated protein
MSCLQASRRSLVWSLTLLLLPAVAAAEDARPFSLERHDPAVRGSAFFVADNLSFKSGAYSGAAGLSLGYSREPISVGATVNDVVIPPVSTADHRVGAWLGGSVAFPFGLRLGLTAPATLAQGGAPTTVARYSYPEASGSALGDIGLSADYRLYDTPALRFALGARLYVPTGARDHYASDGSVQGIPRVMFAGDAGPITWAAETGVALRRASAYGDFARGNELFASVGTAFRFLDRFSAGPELTANYLLATQADTSRPDPAIEALLGGHALFGRTSLGLAVGHSVVVGLGTPTWRALASVDLAFDLFTGHSQPEPELEAMPPPPEPEPPPEPVASPPAPPPAAPEPPPAPPPPPAFESLMLHFTFDKTELPLDEQAALERARDYLVQYPKARVVISGHTDTSGSIPGNQRRSERRAKAVESWFIAQGIAPERITAQGYGSSTPIADNATREGRIENRRVEVAIGE